MKLSKRAEKLRNELAEKASDKFEYYGCDSDTVEDLYKKAFKAGYSAARLEAKVLETALEVYAMTNETFPEYGTVAKAALKKYREEQE